MSGRGSNVSLVLAPLARSLTQISGLPCVIRKGKGQSLPVSGQGRRGVGAGVPSRSENATSRVDPGGLRQSRFRPLDREGAVAGDGPEARRRPGKCANAVCYRDRRSTERRRIDVEGLRNEGLISLHQQVALAARLRRDPPSLPVCQDERFQALFFRLDVERADVNARLVG